MIRRSHLAVAAALAFAAACERSPSAAQIQSNSELAVEVSDRCLSSGSQSATCMAAHAKVARDKSEARKKLYRSGFKP